MIIWYSTFYQRLCTRCALSEPSWTISCLKV